MIFSNIKQFLDKYKKILYYIGFFLVLFIFSGDITFAQAEAVKEKTWADTITEGGSAILGVLGLLLGFATYLATLFLSPEWINGTIFGLDAKFKDVWILVSNVVYFIFAFILIWIAFMNIIGKTSDQYQLKQALPKFIVGVLIVPFSWFLVQFILSISSILTVAALSLPEETFSQYRESISKVTPPTFCIINLDKFGGSTTPKKVDNNKTATVEEENSNDGWITCPENTNEIPDNAINSIFKIIGLYTYGILSFDSMDELITNFEGQEIETVGNLAVQIIFDLLFVVIYAILIITLTLVLLIRGIYIWIYIMISPIFGLMYFFDKKEGGEGFFAKFNIKEFIALAMVPVYTMLALSFGLLFIYVVGEGLTKDTGPEGTTVTVNKGNENILEIGAFKLKIIGKVGSAEGNDVTGFFNSMSEEGGNALGVIGTLILKVFGIIVLWGAVMAAMRTSEITKAITEPIHAFGQSVGKIASSAPGNIPVFGGQSANSLSSAASTTHSHIQGKASKKGADFAGKFIDQDKDIRKIQDAVRGLDGGSNAELVSKAIKDLINATDTTKKSHVDAMVKGFNQIGFENIKTGDILNQTPVHIGRHLFNNKNEGTKVTTEIDQEIEYINLLKIKAGSKDPSVPRPEIDNEIKLHYSNTEDNKIIRIDFNSETIKFTNDGKIGNEDFDNFARAIKGLTKTEAKLMFDRKGLDFDTLYEEAKDKLGNNLKEEDGTIVYNG